MCLYQISFHQISLISDMITNRNSLILWQQGNMPSMNNWEINVIPLYRIKKTYYVCNISHAEVWIVANKFIRSNHSNPNTIIDRGPC